MWTQKHFWINNLCRLFGKNEAGKEGSLWREGSFKPQDGLTNRALILSNVAKHNILQWTLEQKLFSLSHEFNDTD